jgi:hypothetical protein
MRQLVQSLSESLSSAVDPDSVRAPLRPWYCMTAEMTLLGVLILQVPQTVSWRYLAHKKTPTSEDPPRTLGIGLRYGPKGMRFLVSEVPLY